MHTNLAAGHKQWAFAFGLGASSPFGVHTPSTVPDREEVGLADVACTCSYTLAVAEYEGFVDTVGSSAYSHKLFAPPTALVLVLLGLFACSLLQPVAVAAHRARATYWHATISGSSEARKAPYIFAA